MLNFFKKLFNRKEKSFKLHGTNFVRENKYTNENNSIKYFVYLPNETLYFLAINTKYNQMFIDEISFINFEYYKINKKILSFINSRYHKPFNKKIEIYKDVVILFSKDRKYLEARMKLLKELA